MADRTQNPNKLTKKEQANTATYKLMSEKIKSLEKSLKKTQDESERERCRKYELDKEVALLKERSKNNIYIEAFKFLSSCGIGFAINYATNGFWKISLMIGIPSIVIFLACILIYKK